ncbi:MAG: hypothetical protein QGG53_44465 [Planctomycetota bacterium]|jgi:hypothetical protein|nr:hypothetical protein [Planctomycetota bacterium]
MSSKKDTPKKKKPILFVLIVAVLCAGIATLLLLPAIASSVG